MNRLLQALAMSGLLMTAAGASWAEPLNLSSEPLFLNNTSNANVMLFVDNSGSMRTEVENDRYYEGGYSSSTNYPGWEICTSTNRRGACDRWSNVSKSAVNNAERESCPSGMDRVRQISNGQQRCYDLPSNNVFDTYPDAANYLNYLLANQPDRTDLDGFFNVTTITRMDVAKQVVTDLLDNTEGVNFGLATFNPDSSSAGGIIVSAIAPSDDPADNGASGDTHLDFMKDKVAALYPTTWTPLAEAYYEITRYFRGLKPHYPTYGSSTPANIITDGAYVNPMKNYCEANYVVVVTDGAPTYDSSFPSSDPALSSGKTLANYDGIVTKDTRVNTSSCGTSAGWTFLPGSDGIISNAGCASTNLEVESATLYLDDLTKFGYDLTLSPTNVNAPGVPLEHRGIKSYTVGFTVDNQMMEDAATNGGGQYFTADNSQQLREALRSTLDEIKNETSSGSGVATNSTRLDEGVLVYQARFQPGFWTGEIRAFSLTGSGMLSTAPVWETDDPLTDGGSRIPVWNERKIFTNLSAAEGIALDWNSFTDEQRTLLLTGYGLDQDRLEWLKGNQAKEQTVAGEPEDGKPFRKRERGLLGDIVNSTPAFAGSQDYGYYNLPVTASERSSYRAFLATKSGKAALFVGANDGMLHAFDGSSSASSGGKELFAYMPGSLLDEVHVLAEPTYNHRYFVDGSPFVADAYVGGSWKTILAGTTGAGGRSVFALNVTNPDNFSADDVLWEYTSANDGDLGYTMGRPVVVKLANGSWAVIVSNGYNSGSQRAVLFIIDLATGNLLKKIDTGVGTADNPNGLGAVTAVPDETRIVRYVYAGDLQGNVWKFDLSSSNTASWGVAYSGSPLFTAEDAGGTPQPITAPPAVGRVGNGYMVYVGTGKFFEVGDNVTLAEGQSVQTFYGLLDKGAALTGSRCTTATSTGCDLQIQTVTESQRTTNNGDIIGLRQVSQNEVGSTHKGWYLDLPSGGERVIYAPIVRAGRIIFATMIPNDAPCEGGGNSWLMELDALSGGMLTVAVFDINGDGVVDEQDGIYAGLQYGEIASTPTVVGNENFEVKLQSGSKGTLIKTGELPPDTLSGLSSWRQLK